MNKQKLMSRLLAGLLAVLIAGSAMGGLIMAFADEKDPDISLPDTVTGGTVYVEPDDDWELLVLENDEDVTIELGDTATMVVQPKTADTLWLGWSPLYNSTIEKLADEHLVNFDVINFTFVTTLKKPVTMTFSTKKPYLYRLDGGKLMPIESEFKDDIHTFSIDRLDCILAADGVAVAG